MIDMSKEYVTRGDGFPARIYATGAGGDYPVHGAFFRNGCWFASSWTEDGLAFSEFGDVEPEYDLIEKPQTVTRWVNVYGVGHGLGTDHRSREAADASVRANRIGVLRVEITGDQFEVFKEDV